MWLTTSRGSVKTRAWKVDPSVAGLVRLGELAVTFTGTVKTYDALDRNTWGAAVAGATSIARATARFSKKNARFFAGYAFDAHQVPLAWTPPGRVFVGIDLDRTALLDEDGVQEGRGRWGGEAMGRATFRQVKQGPDPLGVLPPDVAATLGRSGEGALTIAGARGPVVRARAMARRGLRAVRRAAGRDARPRRRRRRRAGGAHDRRGEPVARARHGRGDGAGHGRLPRARRARLGREDRPGDRHGAASGRRRARAHHAASVSCGGRAGRAGAPRPHDAPSSSRSRSRRPPRRRGRSRATPATCRSGTSTSCGWTFPRAACSSEPPTRS